jgi:hypothetical protein
MSESSNYSSLESSSTSNGRSGAVAEHPSEATHDVSERSSAEPVQVDCWDARLNGVGSFFECLEHFYQISLLSYNVRLIIPVFQDAVYIR